MKTYHDFGRLGIEPVFFGNPSAPLEDFLRWFAFNGNAIPQSPIDGVSDIGNGPSLIVHYEPPFQVQLFVCRPNTLIPVHCHPNCESYEMNISGDIDFFVDGKPTVPYSIKGLTHKNAKDVPRIYGYYSHVPAGCYHQAIIGNKGGAFLSIQKWNGSVNSVDMDWIGQYMDEKHKSEIFQKNNKNQDYISGQLCD